MVLSLIPFCAPALCQSGSLRKISKENLGEVHWDSETVPADRLGLFKDGSVIVGVFRTLTVDRKKGAIRLLDRLDPDVPTRGMSAELTERSCPTANPGEALLIVWSDEVNAGMRIDGQEAAGTPVCLTLDPGQHEAVVRLSGGVSAGAKLNLLPGSETPLHLRGLRASVSSSWNPDYLLYEKPWNRGSTGQRDWLQWIDETDGTRIYLSQGPIKAPKALHREWPKLRGMPEAPGDERAMVEFIVGIDGRVQRAQVVAHKGQALVDSSLEAIRQCVYQPATLDGIPVPVITSTVFYVERVQ